MSNEKHGKVVVAIDKDKNSQSALKWAIDHLAVKGKHVTLLHVHVQPKPSAVLTSSGTKSYSFNMNDEVARAFKSEANSQLKDLFFPFRCFCTRKNIHVDEVIIEDSDIVAALCNYVKEHVIENLVLGVTTKVGIARKFMSLDISGSVSNGAPEFCNVYAINRGKIATVRSATSALPSSPPRSMHQVYSAPNLRNQQYSMPQGVGVTDLSRISSDRVSNDSNSIKSPFSRNSSKFNNFSPKSPSSGTKSFVNTHRRRQESGFNSRLSNSVLDNTSNFGSIFSSGRLPPESNTSFSTFSSSSQGGSVKSSGMQLSDGKSSFGACSASSNESNDKSSSVDELEAEMRRLQNELKQTMDMYHTASKQSLIAKHKVTEIEELKTEEDQIVENSRLSEEMALAIAERERVKCKAAIEAAETAQKIAELEVRRRKRASKEAEELKKMLNVAGITEARYRKYTIEEIEAATENFSSARKIGEGGYGPVFQCYLDHTPVAVKVLRADAVQGESQFKQEVEVLSSIRHPNMVLLLGACPDNGCLVYEYMANGSLDDCIFPQGNKPVLPWQYRFRIAAEIATGLLFLHQAKPEPLVHRDLKPGNILLDRNYVSKISDVGLARLVPPSVADTVTQYHMTSAAGTFCYIDPEYQQTGMLGTKSDIYSLGVMLLQIITARPPMALTHHIEKAIQRGRFEEMLDPAVQDWPVEDAMNYAKLALKCTELRKKDRPDLGKEILPELNRLRVLAEQSMPHMI